MSPDFEKKLGKKIIDTGKGKLVYFTNTVFPGRPTVVFLHGLSANHTTWLKLMEALDKNGYNSLAPDMRGHGFSDKKKKKNLYGWPVFCEDLKIIVEKENLGNFVLVGYSFGGSVALDFAASYPGRAKGLILISTNHVNPLKYKKINFLTPLAMGIISILSLALLWQGRKKYLYYRQGESRGYWHSVWIGLNTMPLAVNFWMLSNFGKLDLAKKISRIKIPALIIRAKKDPFVFPQEAEDMKRAISGSEEVVFNNPSHFIGSRSQDEIAEVILDFLKKYENSHF